MAKFADHLPLHRQAKIFRRFGVELSDRTMCGWMRQCAEMLEPLYQNLKDFVLAFELTAAIVPFNRIAGRQDRRVAKQTHADLLAVNVLDHEIT